MQHIREYVSNFESLHFRQKFGVDLYMNNHFVKLKFKYNSKDLVKHSALKNNFITE